MDVKVNGIIDQKDKLVNDSSILYSGEILIRDKQFIFGYDQEINEISFSDNEIYLYRKTELEVSIYLNPNKETNAQVVHPFGTTILGAKLRNYVYEDGFWEIEYCLYDGEIIVIDTIISCHY
ncbi:MAG: hypothetical protein ACK5KQ_01600 [Anaerorhabdus sp.]